MNTNALAGVTLAACSTMVLGAAWSAPATAGPSSGSGQGSMTFGHEESGRGYLSFTVRGGDRPAASLLFAGEHHDAMFPDILVHLGAADEVAFTDRTVKFSGSGLLQDDPVHVVVEADDHGTSKQRADRFKIKCTDPGGHVVFEADGHLFRGDIRIGEE